MNNVSVRCLLAPLLACSVLFVAASAFAQTVAGNEGAQRVLQQLTRGASARQAIDALRGLQVPAASADAGRGADARQLDQAQQQLQAALQAYADRGGALTQLAGRYDVWRAAAQVVQIKFTAEGERLKQSSDGAAYIGRHEKAQSQVLAAFARVQALLDPLFVPNTQIDASRAKTAATQALALLRRQQTRPAEAPILRAQAVPFGGLSLAPRQPVLTPALVPTYETKTETASTAEDNAATAQAPLTDEVIAKAKALGNDYVRIYEFVRNTTRNEWYAGSVKGAVGALRSGAGNDVDQASLLTALLRAAGLNTRYVQGVVEVPLERLASELGLPTADAAFVPAALTKAGLAYSPVVRAGRVAAVQLARTWVSAYVPYTNYRGALVDASGKTWIPLDPFYKTVSFKPSSGLFGRSFTAAALSTEYQSHTSLVPFGEFLRLKTASALNASGSTGTWDSQRNSSANDTLQLDILPNSLPYAVTAVTREAADLPASELATVRIRLYQGSHATDPVVLDKTLPMADAVNSRVTLSYGPASLEDHRVSLLYGGMDAVPLYLIGLRGQLKLGGDVAAAATDRVEPGASLRLSIELSGPWGVQEVDQTVVAGAYHALVIANDPPRPETAAASDGEYLGARLLDGLGVFYAKQWNDADRDIAGWLDTGVVRPVPAVTLASTTVRPSLVAGVPVTLEWTGVSIDAALRPVDAVGASASDFLTLSALAGSSLEQYVFNDQFSVDAISADRGVQLANEQGIRVLDLASANLGALDATDHSDSVKAAVRDLVRQGHNVRIPERQLTVNAWTGSVWQAFKGGRAGFFISGGLAGGETVIPPELWTLGFLADAFAAMQTEEANNDPRSGVKVSKVGAGDGQRGTVGQALTAPYAVQVFDKLGRPVKGAQVTFTVITGDAKLAGGNSSITLPTNVLGMASTSATLGQSTGINSVWIMRNPGDEFATQVGWVNVDAYVDSAAGTLQPPEPFSALALPDVLADLKPKSDPATAGWPSDTADVLSLGTIDQYANPIANVSVNFSINSTPSCPADGPPGNFKPGALWDASVSAKACASGRVLGQCGSQSLSLKTASNGVVFAGVVLSNELGGTNRVSASANGVSRQFTYTNNGACVASTSAVTYYGYLGTSGGEADGEGNTLTAASPGQAYPGPFQVSLYRSEYPYFFDSNGKVRFQPYLNWVPASGNIDSVNVSNGGSAAISSSSFTVRTGAAPGRNTSTVSASVTVTGIENTLSGPQTFSRPVSASTAGGTVFGVKPTITAVVSRNVQAGADPNKIHLDGSGKSLYPIEVQYKVEPADYRNSSNAWIANVLKDGAWAGYAAGDSPIDTGKALLPRSLTFQPNQHQYQAQLVTKHTITQLESAKFDLPLRQKLIADMHASGASRYVDEVNKRVCDRPGTVAFMLTQDALASVTYQALGADDVPLGLPQELVAEKAFPIGVNEVGFDAAKLGSGSFQIVVKAKAAADPSLTDEASHNIEVHYRLSNALPVGQILVKGVNARNGILTYQTPRLSLPGRGNPLDFVASYSSAAAGELSSTGANWTHNHDLGLSINSCGEVSVSAGDSGSVRFFPKPDGSMAPDKGYHGTLIANRADNTWDFFSKDGTTYHYKYFNRRVQWKLVQVSDRNGNTQTYEYDTNAFPDPLLSKVQRSDGRSLSFTYQSRNILRPGKASAGQSSVLTRVEASGDQKVELDYDTTGNLISHAVNGRTSSFAYSTDAVAVADRYRLLTATDAKGDKTQYTYGLHPIQVRGADFTLWLDHLTVSDVTTPLGGTMSLAIDTTAWLSSKVTNVPGGTTSYTFNAYGNPLSIIDTAGTTSMTWADADVLMTTKADGRGVTTSFDYDTEGNVTRESVAGKSTSYTYEIQTSAPYSKSRLTSRTDRNGNSYTFQLDAKGNVSAEQLPIGSVTHTYAGNGDRLSSTDANGHTTRYDYDPYGNMSASTSPVGARTETPRDSRGRVSESTDGNGNRTRFQYDGQDNLIQRTNAAGGVRTSSYDTVGNKLTETDEGGRTTTWSYSKGSLVDTITLSGPGGSASRQFSYDGAGNKLSETDWKGNTTRYSYDDALRLKTRTEPLGKLTTYAYDAVGNLTSETTADRVTTHEYDELSRRTKTTDAEGKAWGNEYDANGNRTATIDPLGRRTEMAYDAMDRLSAVNQPLGRSTTYGYDTAGNKTRDTDPNGNVTQNAYDAANRLVTITRPDGNTQAFVYDNANNLTRQTDAGGGISQFTYDALNRKLTARDPEGGTTSYGYDPLGNLTHETWANGNPLRHGYDLFNRRTSSTDALGALGSWEYDNAGNLTAETDGNGNRSTHSYNALNQRTGSSLPGGRSPVYLPDLFGNVLEATDARGNKTTTRYDKLNRATKVIFADGGVIDTVYDAAGNKTSQTDALGHPTRFVPDALNRITTVTDALGGQVQSSYDPVGNLLTQTDKRGTLSEHRYDALNRRVGSSKAGIELEALTYTPLGQVDTHTDANGNRTRFSYDKRGLQTSQSAPEGATTLSQRDAMGDVVQSTDPEGRISSVAYDARRRPTHSTNPAGEPTQFEYDLNNHKTAQQRPSGARTSYVYDNRNWLTAVAEPLARTAQYDRDANGNLTRFTDAGGHATAYGYDKLNRRASVTYPGGATESFNYDLAGNLTQHIDANGVAITRVFDGLNREISKSYSASVDGLASIATVYDANGNPITVSESYSAGAGAGARVSTYTYDAFDRQLSVQDGFGAQMAYAYDPAGNRKTLATQDAKVTRYGYDGLNRLTGLSSPAGSVQYRYDRSGLTLAQTWGNGTGTSSSYDAASRPLRIALSKGATPLNLTEYRYDLNGNRTEERINRPGGAQLTSYAYDAADRLTGTKRVEGANAVDTGWAYDAADNRLSETVVSSGSSPSSITRSYTYDARNQLTQIADSAAGTTTLSYDLQGNLTQKLNGSDTTAFVWNARDHLASVSRNGTVLGRYSTDHTGLRVSKEALNPLQPGAPPRVLRTQWDEENAVQDRDTAGTVIARYDFAEGRPVALWSAEDGNQLLHADALGSIVATTAADGSVKSETLYDAWGNPTTTTGSSANKFAYTGHQADAESGLYYFKARYYDPSIGRFISQDPAEGQDERPDSYQKYLYAYGNPLFYTDPTGRYSWSEFGVDVAGGLAGAGLGVAMTAVAVVEVAGDAAAATHGDLGAAMRTAQRAQALGHAVMNPRETAARIKQGVNEALDGASREEADGNVFTAAIVRGKLAADVVLAIDGGVGLVRGGVALTAKAAAAASARTATKVVAEAEAGAAQAATRGTRTAESTGTTVTEATVPKQTGRITVEGEGGPGVDSAPGKTVTSAEAKASPEVSAPKVDASRAAQGETAPSYAVDKPMFGNGGASSLTRRQYVEANLRESAAARESSSNGFETHAANERIVRESGGGNTSSSPNTQTGAGYGVNDSPVRIAGRWSKQDIFNALMGRTPKGLASPDLHHADQMPGSAIHEVVPNQHRGNKALHPNGNRNQGVTAEMRKADKELHWWYRAREQGADTIYPDLIYDK